MKPNSLPARRLGSQTGRTVGDALDRYEKDVSSTKRWHRFESLRLAAIGKWEISGKQFRDIRLAKEWKWIAANPATDVRGPKESEPRDRLYTADEMERICRVATLTGTKNGSKRKVLLSKRAVELLELPPPEENGTLFGVTAKSLDALFRKAMGGAGVDGATFHDTRHLAITRLAKKLKVLDLARMAGQRDLKQLQVYYNETAEAMADKLG